MTARRPEGTPTPPPSPDRLVERRLQELQLLHEMGQRITSLLDVHRLLPEMVEQLRRVLGVEIVSVMLLDAATGQLRIEAAAGLPGDVVESARVPLGIGISGQVAQQGQPVLIRDMSQHPRFGRSPYHAQYTTESLICVPLKLGDRVLGVINVNNKLTGESLDDEDLALVTTFSSQAALAIENSRLYGSLEAEVKRVTAALELSNQELRAVQEFTESIIRNMSTGLMALDRQGRVTKVNQAAVALLGPEGGAPCVGETLESLLGEEAARRVREDGMGTGPGERREALAMSRHGRQALIGYSTSPLLDAAGDQVGLVVIFRDLTQVKKMEAELVRMDRMASLGVLGAGIAHEIRNPLAAIRFNLDFLREGGASQPELEVILKNVARLDDLVKKLLRFARPTPPSFEAQSLALRVEAVVTLIANQATASGVEVVTDFSADLPDVWIDGPQVEQVVLNIALNAIQAMTAGGRLTLRTRLSPHGRGPRHAQLLVTDTGPGLDAEQARQVFDPFYTTRKEGTGLGLTVAHRIVEDHGGYIEVAPPSPGKGTTFVVGFRFAGSSGAVTGPLPHAPSQARG